MNEDLFLARLETIIRKRLETGATDSYTVRLADAGTRRIAQKVGEEAVEVALAATSGDREELLNESADLLYHLLVLLADRQVTLADVDDILAARHAG